MKRIWKFTRAVLHHWGILFTGGVGIGALGLWQMTGHNLSPKVGWIVGGLAVLAACFKAWNEQYERAESLLPKTPFEPPYSIDLSPPPSGLEALKATLEDEEPEPKLTIEVVKSGPTIINHDDFCSFMESPQGFPAVVMSFKNQLAKPGQQNETLRKVTANLMYEGADRTEHIDYGNWLKHYTRYTDFNPGDTRDLIIAMKERETGEIVGLYNQKTQDPRQMRFRSGWTIYGPKDRPLPKAPCTVTVTLVSKDITLFSDTYVLNWNEAREFEFKKRAKVETS